MRYKGHKIEKRKDGRYQVRIYINKKQVPIYGRTQEELKQKLRDTLETANVIKLPRGTKMHDYCDQWYRVYKEPSLKRITLKTTKGILENHIKKHVPNININSITPMMLNDALNKISGRPKEYASQYLREMFKRAYEDKVIRIDIHESIAKYVNKREEGVALNKQQRAILIEQCFKLEHGDAVLFYLYTGCRRGEGFRISKTDVHDDFIYIPGTKTDDSKRIVPITKQLRPIVNKFMKGNRKKLLPISDTTLKRTVEELRKMCKFHFKIKDLRTTFGTMCAEAGVSDSVIAKWMGHTTTNTTKKYYIKVLTDFERVNASKIDTYFDT